MVWADVQMHRQRPYARWEHGESSSSLSDHEDDDQTKDECQANNDHTTDIFKDIDLYLAAKNGNLDDFSRVLDQVSATEHASFAEVLSRASPAGNTLLHVAVTNGNQDIATYIAAKSPDSLFAKNFNEDSAFHLASKAGYKLIIRSLVRILGDLGVSPSGTEDIVAARNNLLSATNEKGNTALLEALNNGRESVARYWIREFPEISYIQNKKWESAIYMAAKAGFAKCISMILRLCTDHERIKEQFKKNSPIQAAVMMHHRDVLEVMLSWNIQLRDGEGRTPLHYAASLGYLEEVRYLLEKCAPCTTQIDNSGSCPIHLASMEGHVDIISLLLQYCPAPLELLDRHGRSILHVAAKSGRYSLVKYILNNLELEELINMKDKDGNTPLHLATKDWHPKIVSSLTWDKRVDVKLVNDMGKTALDVAEYHMSSNPPFHQRLTWAALTAAGTPRSSSGKTAKRPNLENSYSMDSFKDRVNTLLLVSTLVATVTFAAGFTMPGGYNSSAPDVGMVTTLRHRGLHIFVFCDTIAMHCSIVASVALIFAQLGDINLVLTAFGVALPLLGIALCMMSMAFTAGVFLVQKWLPITTPVTPTPPTPTPTPHCHCHYLAQPPPDPYPHHPNLYSTPPHLPNLQQCHSQFQETQTQTQTHRTISSLIRRIAALESALLRRSSSSSSSHTLRDAAARIIQTHFRAFLLRRSRTLRQLKDLASIKSTLTLLKSAVSEETHFDYDLVYRKGVALVLRLDAIQGGDPMIRDGKRALSRDLNRFLDFIDGFCVERRGLSRRVSVRYVRSNVKSRTPNSERKVGDLKSGVLRRVNEEKLRGLAERINKLSEEMDEEEDEEVESPVIRRHGISESRRGGLVERIDKLSEELDEEEDEVTESPVMRRNVISQNRRGGLVGQNGEVQPKVKKTVSFAENGKVYRVVRRDSKPLLVEDFDDSDVRDGLVEASALKDDLCRAVEEIGISSKEAEDEDEEEAHSEEEGSLPSSDGEKDARSYPRNGSYSGMRNHDQYEDEEFTFSAPLPVKVDARADLVEKRTRIAK